MLAMTLRHRLLRKLAEINRRDDLKSDEEYEACLGWYGSDKSRLLHAHLELHMV